MSRRGKRAELPPADHRSEPPLKPDGLVVKVVNKAGYTKEFDFAALPVPEPMQRSLARLFAAQSRVWTSHETAKTCWSRVMAFATFLSELESTPQDLDGLTVAMLKRWRARHVSTVTGKAVLSTVRLLLQQDPRFADGPVTEELLRRFPAAKPSKQSYAGDERKGVVLAAQRQFRAAWLRIGENTRLLRAWRAGDLEENSRDWRLGAVLDHLARTGDVPRSILPSGQSHVDHRNLLGGAGPEQTWGRLFLSREELTALAVLLTDRFAWNLKVYDRLPTPTAGSSVGEKTATTYQVKVEKRRAGGGRWFSTEDVTDSGADSPGRLITQALEATAHGRELAARLAPGTDLLMVSRLYAPRRAAHRHQDTERPRPVGPLSFGIAYSDAQRWAQAHGLGGSPFQRTRRTTVTREGVPRQHSQSTHERVYVLPDEHVKRASRSVFADGAEEALEQAEVAVFGGHLADAPDPEHDQTATADCEDETTSPWPTPEGGCGADFLLCLACKNAYVHPGHHPRLALLRQQLDSLRSVLDEGVWNERWQDHSLRLEDLRDKVGAAAWDAALARAGSDDHALVQLLVKGDLAP
ncbi:hypothetical protein [Streptomyces alkaliterrae]|uniref:Uncharacterized protein n=1 Tax=Streptomyces alkaliterrae TaxID=2213162 RepID=A0A5P0YW72_9ACTN|nr:hypothetical protein [Streptomyces alkaliterrae]MBB1257442.1 hypothetical protein [Streptomyces alkaliterrae]MQS04536.1 hypothetical protein [Streptomyces alkaliterrae]